MTTGINKYAKGNVIFINAPVKTESIIARINAKTNPAVKMINDMTLWPAVLKKLFNETDLFSKDE